MEYISGKVAGLIKAILITISEMASESFTMPPS
jgi:hypothetical protein